ncbi:MAG TPA: PAS domain-containing protein [Vicinamibacterales bacterium]|nr:PAS domain-containing protein [Vicinamibacterales bacterium]
MDRPTLEETIALLEATLDATHDAILVVDLKRRVIHSNRQFLEMFRLTREDIDAGGLDAVLRRMSEELDDRNGTLVATQDLWTDPASRRLDVLRFKDGRIIERYVAPHQIGSRVVGRVASFRDVGSTVRTAESLEQHRAFLEQAQTVAHIGSWVAELDGSGNVGWSAETHRIFGVPAGQFDGTSEAFFELVHTDDREAVRAAGAAAIERDRAFDIEHRIVRPDGSVRWVQECGSLQRDATGNAVRMIGTVQDITERRQLEDQLRQAQKMEAIGRLAGGIAHDLNNALTTMAGYAELALGELQSDHVARADVEEIRRAAERAGSVTRQLLAFSRKQLLQPRVFNLNGTVAAISRLLSRLLGPDVRVQTALADAQLDVLGDPGQIEQAIINLAVNARDAMPAGGQLTMSTAIEPVDDEYARTHLPITPGTFIVLRVADTGHGMSRETQARVFEPFFTTKDAGKGTGLGLSMVYGTMKQIGGFIFVDSELGRGTTFRLLFPPAAGQEAPAEGLPPAQARTERPRGHETLLIAEDEPAVRNLVASALRNDGYKLLLAASADEALAIADAHRGAIDLLLTDAMMPGRTGVELAAILVDRYPHLRVIIMSGYTEETLSLSERTTRVAMLQKPFTPRDLRRRIREAIDR